MPIKRIKRNKGLMILLLPVIVYMFFAGWILYIAGRPSSGTPQKLAPRDAKPVNRIMIGCIPCNIEGE